MIRKLNILSITFLLLSGQFICLFAQESEPIILSEPEDWRYEKINFPLDFAPEIPYVGFEELRFAPGMFDRLSPAYFTYVFAVSIDNKVKFKKGEVKEFLTKYYRGLCYAVGKSKELPIDTAKIKVTLNRSGKVKRKNQNYTAQIIFFDVFNNGEEILLNMELEIISEKDANKSYILALVSPDSQQSKVWRKLYQIREKVRATVNNKT